ncbi:unnamed protein product, partial [Timema podura]|nr:unnamed protein product [Timema podura]
FLHRLVYSSVIAIALIATLRDDGNAVQLKYRGKLEKMLMAFSIKKTLPRTALSGKRGRRHQMYPWYTRPGHSGIVRGTQGSGTGVYTLQQQDSPHSEPYLKILNLIEESLINFYHLQL